MTHFQYDILKETKLPSGASFHKSSSNKLAELYSPFGEETIIRPLRKSGIKWICEIVNTGDQQEFTEDEFFFL
jgi:hypothetical protein